MSQRTVLLVFTLLTTLTVVPASAGWSHRQLGLGWSDGYHSHTGCSPCEPRFRQPRDVPPGYYYEVPTWLPSQLTPATPEAVQPALPAPESRRPTNVQLR